MTIKQGGNDDRRTRALQNRKRNGRATGISETSTPLAQMAFSLTSSVNGVRVAVPKARAARAAVTAAPTASLQKVRHLLETL